MTKLGWDITVDGKRGEKSSVSVKRRGENEKGEGCSKIFIVISAAYISSSHVFSYVISVSTKNNHSVYVFTTCSLKHLITPPNNYLPIRFPFSILGFKPHGAPLCRVILWTGITCSTNNLQPTNE